MIIYKATNLINDKKYIGQTIDTLEVRKSQHKNRSKSNSNRYFHSAIRKYGWENFNWEEIDKAGSLEELDYLETYWINWYHSRDKRYGYNLAEGGRVNRGSKWTDEQKERHSKTIKQTMTKERRMSHSSIMKEKHKNGEMSPYFKGKTIPKETIKKMSEAKIGKYVGENSPSFGLKRSEETKRKIGLVHKGRISKLRKKVLCIETGTVYDSVMNAQKAINQKGLHIASVCRGERKTCGGYHWKYIGQ